MQNQRAILKKKVEKSLAKTSVLCAAAVLAETSVRFPESNLNIQRETAKKNKKKGHISI